MTAPAAPHAALATARIAEIDAHFEVCERQIRDYGRDKMRDFITSGIRYWTFKQALVERNAVHPPEEQVSFYAWLADPQNCVDSATYVTLGTQVIELFHVYFKIRLPILSKVGRAKFGYLCPEMEVWKAEIELGKREWIDGKERALAWIRDAETNSVTALQSLLIENTIQYTGDSSENASNPLNGGHKGNWDVLRERTPIVGAALRDMTKDELLGWLGLSDVKDETVYIQVVRRTKEQT